MTGLNLKSKGRQLCGNPLCFCWLFLPSFLPVLAYFSEFSFSNQILTSRLFILVLVNISNHSIPKFSNTHLCACFYHVNIQSKRAAWAAEGGRQGNNCPDSNISTTAYISVTYTLLKRLHQRLPEPLRRGRPFRSDDLPIYLDVCPRKIRAPQLEVGLLAWKARCLFACEKARVC